MIFVANNIMIMTWQEVIEEYKSQFDFKLLMEKVDKEYNEAKCFPPKEEIFRALDLTPFDKVKVVILGQDPYHGNGQANGLAFSVNNGVKIPPSLRNMFKELYDDLGITKMNNELDDWARQGVLLLNATLTVRANEANSHKDLGWEHFTNYLIKKISLECKNTVFVLWGSFAQKKEELIDSSSHCIIKSAHPSPLSAYRGFFGSRPFSLINNYLLSVGKEKIDW